MSGARLPFCRGMDTKRWMVAVAATAVLGGCATPVPKPVVVTPAPAPVATPASALVDHAGDSIETAVEVPADAPDEGIRFQNNWMYDHFGTFRRLGGGTGNAAGRRYDVIDIELKNGEKHKVFFDITENWNRWTPPK
jgi:hypothetical protein